MIVRLLMRSLRSNKMIKKKKTKKELEKQIMGWDWADLIGSA